MGVELIWLMVMLAGGTLWLRRDVAAYQRFVLLDDSQARQRSYGLWIAQSFLILTGASLVSLWLVGGLSPFDTFPAPFEALNGRLTTPERPLSPDMMLGMAIGISANLLIFLLVQRHKLRKLIDRPQQPLDPLIPRNRHESLYAVALSINAGFSEELFFRLALPLLLYHITGNLLLSFGLAALGFGLAHAYQGWKGVLATMFVGGILTLIYLKSGSLLKVILLHAAIDLVAFFVRPQLARLARNHALRQRSAA